MTEEYDVDYAEHSDYDYLLKIILVGDSGVGKSCLLKSYMTNRWDETYTSTIGVDFEIKHIVLDEKKVNLQIERFRTITTSYYRVSDVVIVVFDLTDQQTFGSLKNWLTDVRSYAPEHADVILVGNKLDLTDDRQVTFENAEQYANERNLAYMETSAKLGLHVDDLFEAIARKALNRKIRIAERSAKASSVHLQRGDQNADSCC